MFRGLEYGDWMVTSEDKAEWGSGLCLLPGPSSEVGVLQRSVRPELP